MIGTASICVVNTSILYFWKAGGQKRWRRTNLMCLFSRPKIILDFGVSFSHIVSVNSDHKFLIMKFLVLQLCLAPFFLYEKIGPVGGAGRWGACSQHLPF